MFPRFVNWTDTQLSAGFFEGYIIHWEVQVGIGRDLVSLVNDIRLIKKVHSWEYPANVDAFVNLRYTHRN